MSWLCCGSIVNMVLQVGELGSSGMSVYVVSKVVFIGVIKLLVKEFVFIGIWVNVVVLGFIDIFFIEYYDVEVKNKVIVCIVQYWVGMVEEVVDVVFYLLLFQVLYMFGYVLLVDGLFCL